MQATGKTLFGSAAALLCALTLTACQAAPPPSSGGGPIHAPSSQQSAAVPSDNGTVSGPDGSATTAASAAAPSGGTAKPNQATTIQTRRPGGAAQPTSPQPSTPTSPSVSPTSSRASSAAKPSASSSAATTTSATRTQAIPDDALLRFRQPGDVNTLGVWWWKIADVKGSRADTYLTFCEMNRVSEIYLCIDGMTASGGTSYADVRAFVRKAAGKGIRVAALSGDVSWINPGNGGLAAYAAKFNAYQQAAAREERFYAMHLDVEPHQHPDFKTNRPRVMQLFADFVVSQAAPAAKAAGTLLEWDIPFWLEDTVQAAGGRKVLAELMTEVCDTIAVMSYRDTAAAMYDVSKEEIAYAKRHGCKVVLGAETYSTEGDPVSYMEEGKRVMAAELTKLNTRLLAAVPDRNFGIAVHQMERWYTLKN